MALKTLNAYIKVMGGGSIFNDMNPCASFGVSSAIVPHIEPRCVAYSTRIFVIP